MLLRCHSGQEQPGLVYSFIGHRIGYGRSPEVSRCIHKMSLEVPSPGPVRPAGEGSHNGWQQPRRSSARQQTEVVLRQLRGEVLDVLSRDLGNPHSSHGL